jgi:acetyltransferase-like isoleucine patch superfamily enzyme
MNPFAYVRAAVTTIRRRAIDSILAHRIRARHPTLVAHYTSLWDYGYRDMAALEIGEHVSVGPFAEIVVHRHVTHSSVEGRLVLGDRCVVGTGTNIRAAGGVIRIGERSNVSQNCTLIAANHVLDPARGHTGGAWDETRTGVTVGANVWVGAGAVLLPGTTIGDNAVIAAGAVVRGVVPENELWGGVPARKLKDL